MRLEQGWFTPALLFYVRDSAQDQTETQKTGGDNRSARIKPNVRKTTPHG